jgi:hypothetical protein
MGFSFLMNTAVARQRPDEKLGFKETGTALYTHRSINSLILEKITYANKNIKMCLKKAWRNFNVEVRKQV